MAIQIEFEAPPATVSNGSLLAMVRCDRLARRGWQFKESDNGVTAHRPEWPSQLGVLVREADVHTPAILGLAVEFASMPLRGERFRAVLNSEREELLRGYGRFNVLQLTHEGTWLPSASDGSFMHGMTHGISRSTRLAVFDRTAVRTPGSVAERFAADSNQIVETASEIAGVLQRLYQRTVLAEAAEVVTDAYPWRR